VLKLRLAAPEEVRKPDVRVSIRRLFTGAAFHFYIENVVIDKSRNDVEPRVVSLLAIG